MTADNELNTTVTAHDAHTEATEAATPIKLTYMGVEWLLDFNRRAIQRVNQTPELRKVVAIDGDKTSVEMLGEWLYSIPALMVIASSMHHANPMKLTTAQAIFDAISNKTAFSARIVGLYVSRLTELMGVGNEDVTETEGQGKNVTWA